VDKYLELLMTQIKYHKLDTKIVELYEGAISSQFSNHHKQMYQPIDKLQTESMLYAESQSSRSFTKKYQ
jgi:hypothetical protein